MILYVADRLVRDSISVSTFFRSAYMWKFGKDANLSSDIRRYEECNEIPPYVREYVMFLQKEN